MSAYDRFRPDELIVRDHLAVDRTELANERTLLAYVRTALALGLTGVTTLHFVVSVTGVVAGSVLLVFGVLLMGLGAVRWGRIQRDIRRIRGAERAAVAGAPVVDRDRSPAERAVQKV